MAYDNMREKTTNVGGVLKRIWYAMTGTTQGAELMSIDEAGKFKCVSEQITGLAGTGTRMVVTDSTGNLSAGGNIYKQITHQSYNATAVYGINYINPATGGQIILLPLAVLGLEIEFLVKTQMSVNYFTMTGTNKIYDIAGNDVTSTYTTSNALLTTKRLRLVATQQIDRDLAPLNGGAVDWVVVEKDSV